MGYDVHITRQENWFDENTNLNISLDEWLELVGNDPEMRLDNFAEGTTLNDDSLRVEGNGLSVWTKYSGDGFDGSHAWFYYFRGKIVVKNPDDEIISKMIDIAEKLDARVQGDEGEIYERGNDNRISHNSREVDGKGNVYDKKRWWKFW